MVNGKYKEKMKSVFLLLAYVNVVPFGGAFPVKNYQLGAFSRRPDVVKYIPVDGFVPSHHLSY